MDSNPPFFIIGNPRSGTTLLRLMLTCHPNICVPPEGGFVIRFLNSFGNFSGSKAETEAFVKELSRVPKMEYWNLDSEALEEFILKEKASNYANLCSCVYRWYATQMGKKNAVIWGDKNNYYLNHIDKLADLFPKGKFLHIVRDGRDIACSYRKLRNVKGKYAPELPTSLVTAAKHWKNNIKVIRNSLKKINSSLVFELKYEDLVTKPQPVLSKVCDFLGVAYDSSMLNYSKKNKDKALEPEDFDDWKKLNKKELTNSRINLWKTEMFDEDIYHFQRICGQILSTYGYDLIPFELKDKVRFNFTTLLK